MGEPETLDTDEALPKRIERHAFDRLIMLSDGVFAIAITLLVLEIKPPVTWSGDLAELVFKTWRSLFGFGLSFVIVGFFWINHKQLFARVRRVDTPLTLLTLLLLCLVSLAPWVAELMATFGPAKAMRPYALLVAAAGVVQTVLWGYAALVAGLVDASLTRRDRVVRFFGLLLIPTVFSLCALFVRPGMSAKTTVPIILLILGANLLRRRLLREEGGALRSKTSHA